MSSKTKFGIASASAMIATVSDFLMLFVTNALRSDLHFPQPPQYTLLVGGLLGVITIPFYALGYSATADAIKPSSATGSKIIFACGIGIAALGAIIHGLTALSIHAAMISGLPSYSPAEALAHSGWGLLTAWIAAAFLTLAASFAMASVDVFHPCGLPFRLALVNPTTIIIFVSIVSFSWEIGRSFLLPAAPNIAHAIFFIFLIFVSYRK